MDCVEIYDSSLDVRNHAATPNRVSDYLGNMWRKGLVLRVPAPKGEGKKARWMYVWKDKGPKKRVKPDLSQAIEYDETVQTLLHKPNLHIEDNGKSVVIETPYLRITIEQKNDE